MNTGFGIRVQLHSLLFFCSVAYVLDCLFLLPAEVLHPFANLNLKLDNQQIIECEPKGNCSTASAIASLLV